MTGIPEGIWTPNGHVAIKDEKALKEVAKAAATMALQPIHENILVRRIPDEELSKGGIVLPDTARNKMILKGIVIAAGPGRRDAMGALIPSQVAPGDIVLVSTYSTATEVEVGGEKLVLTREVDVLGKFVPLPPAPAPAEQAP